MAKLEDSTKEEQSEAQIFMQIYEDFFDLITIDSLMKLCEVIWRKFDLANLCSFMSIRRFHFNAVCQKLEPDNYVAYKPLLESS